MVTKTRLKTAKDKNYTNHKDAKGRFVKGNPGGCQPAGKSEIAQLVRDASPAAVKKLISIMNNRKAAHKDQIACAKIILERAYGKPKQIVEDENSTQLNLPQVVVQMNAKEFNKMKNDIKDQKPEIDDELE